MLNMFLDVSNAILTGARDHFLTFYIISSKKMFFNGISYGICCQLSMCYTLQITCIDD